MRSSKNGKWPRLMFQTKKLKVLLWILSIALGVVCAGLTGCGSVQPLPTATSAPSATITTLPTFTSVAPLPTLTPGNPTVLPVSTPISSPAPIPISTATEIFPLDNLRMAYIVDGNLYVQNGSNPPQQLTDSGQDIYPMFSDDGEKIIFYRGKSQDKNSIFSINADGSHEQEIITKDWLDTLGTGTKAGHLAFVPNTHQFLFNTYLCPTYDPSSNSGCTVGLFLIDSDTGKIKEILKPALGGYLHFDGDPQWLSNFSISPDGNLLSVAHDGQIDILDTDGKTLHRGIVKYVSGTPYELYPKAYWFPDSSGLIIALPAKPENFSYTVWKYTFNDNAATQILLDPPPVWTHIESNDVISVSPNREWILYFTEDYKLYKGNLLDGNTDLLLPYGWFLPMQWNSDSTHFAIGANASEALLGSV
ncbi:MAG: hypothetical protein ACOY0R_21885, partial [Chloroflexota bacterium]